MSATAAAQRPVNRPSSGLRIGIVVSLSFLLLGFVSIVWTPYPVTSLDVGAALHDPSGAHWLGTDQLGRDVLSLLMKGVLTSFVVAAVAVALGALLGIPLGVAAFAGGRLADLAVRGVTGYLSAVPVLIGAIVLAALFGPNAATVMVAIGVGNIPAFAKVTRDGFKQTDQLGYVEAARLAGSAPFELARRHIFPALGRLLLAQAVVQLGIGILAEAGLSYIAVGAQAPATSLGLLLRDASAYASLRPTLMLAPGIAIVAIVLALNATSRGLRATVAPLPEADDGAA